MDTELEKLIVLNLKYSSRERTLNRYVFADFSLKALFQIQKAMDKKEREHLVPMNEIYKVLSSLLGLKDVPRRIVKEAIPLLKAENKVVGDNSSGWKLTESAFKEITKKLASEDNFMEQVLKRHFPADIKSSTLKKWFYDTSAQLFSKFGDTVVANITGDGAVKNENFNLGSLIEATSAKYQLRSKKQSLFIGYENFITSENHDDQKLIMDLAIRWFGARLVVANVGDDPITIEEMKKSKFILDTNVLVSIALGRRPFAKSIVALGKALQEIEAELVYLATTREEYKNLIDHRSDMVCDLFKTYSKDKIEELHIDDNFVKAVLDAGCKDAEEVKSFFQKIRNIPEKLENGPVITLSEDDVIEKKLEAVARDTALLNLIKATKTDVFPKEYSDYSIKHDAGLIRIAEFLSEDEGRKVWALSLDYGLKQAGIKAAGSDIPRVMGVETLIEFLALSSLGAGMSSSDFAPLLANILKNHCLPYGGSQIVIGDLIKLQATIQEAPNLPVENINQMVRIVAKARIENKPIEDVEVQASLVKLQNREFKKIDAKMQESQYKLNEATRGRQLAEAATKKEKELRRKLGLKAVNDRAFRLRLLLAGKFIRVILFRLVCITVLLVAILHFSDNFIDPGISFFELLVDIIGLGAFIAWIVKPIGEIYHEWSKAEQNAKDAIESEMQENFAD